MEAQTSGRNQMKEKPVTETQKSCKLKKISESTILAAVIGIVLRILCYSYVRPFLMKRPELTSPLVSYRRLQDGVAMFNDGISPYEGDSFHFQPVLLRLYSLGSASERTVFTISTILDCLTAALLSISAGHYAKQQKSANPEHVCIMVFKCYLWNPVTIGCTAILSVSVLHNVLISAFVYFFCSGLLLPCVLVLSLCISLSIYPVIIAASVLLRFSSLHQRIFTLFCLTSGFVAMLIFNWFLNNMNWNFLDDTYGFILRVDDLTPNVGLFWYFFTQVFEHFRVFYLVVFQINLLVYVVPLLLSLRKDAYLHLVISLLLMAVFSSYPTLNDASTYLALLPMLDKYWKYPRYTLVVSCTIVTCVVLMPVMWHIWIVVGSGNANFYFAVTLIYNIAQFYEFLLFDDGILDLEVYVIHFETHEKAMGLIGKYQNIWIYLMIDLMFAYFRSEADEVAMPLITSKTKFVLH